MKVVIPLALVTGALSAGILHEFFGVGLSVLGGLAMIGAFILAVIWLRRLERNEKPLPPPPTSLTARPRAGRS